MKKAVYNVMVITIVAKLLGFGREILLAYFFGANGMSDAYLISQTIPGTIFQFVGTGLATSFIPVYMKIKNQEGAQRADFFTNTVLSAILIFSTIVIIIVLSFTEPIIKMFASGFTGQTLENAIFFSRICIFSLYLSAILYVFSSYLQANDIFSVVSFVAVPNSIMIMVAIILGAKWNIIALPVGSLLAVLLQVIILWPTMKKRGYRLRINWKFKDEYIKEICILMIPVTIGVSINQINVLVDRTIASRVAVGGISALTYADSLIMFVQGIFSQSIATVYYPSIARIAEEKNEIKLISLLEEAIGSMVFILMPIMIGCIILANGIVRVLYGRGAFDETAIGLTGTALALYGVGILGYGIREILSRVFYAFHDTKTPMVNAMVGMILNIIMNVTLAEYLGIGGLALATSLSSIITAILLYIALKRRQKILFSNDNLKEYIKMIIAVSIMGCIVFFVYNLTKICLGYIGAVVISIAAGIITYMLFCKILNVKIYHSLIKMFFKRENNI